MNSFSTFFFTFSIHLIMFLTCTIFWKSYPSLTRIVYPNPPPLFFFSRPFVVDVIGRCKGDLINRWYCGRMSNSRIDIYLWSFSFEIHGVQHLPGMLVRKDGGCKCLINTFTCSYREPVVRMILSWVSAIWWQKKNLNDLHSMDTPPKGDELYTLTL